MKNVVTNPYARHVDTQIPDVCQKRRSISLLGVFMVSAFAVLGTTIPTTANADCLDPPGDVTGDGQTSVVDVQCTILTTLAQLNNSEAPLCQPNGFVLADLNCDASVTVVDVQIDIALTLGQLLDVLLDANQNKCVDACEGQCGPGSNGQACDDGDGCTENDSCMDGACAGAPLNCDDGNICTTDSCGAAGCVNTAVSNGSPTNCVIAHDGTGCDTPSCQNCVCGIDAFCCTTAWDGICAGEAANECAAACPVNAAVACDDGDPCTQGDVCTDGACVGGPINCDDGIGCTDDFCEPGVGCVSDPGETLEFSNKSYLFCAASVSYDTAKNLCASYGGQVTTVNSAEENTFLSSQATTLGLNSPWIGYNDIAQEGTFVWDSGEPVTFTGWCLGEPNDFNGSEDCTHLNWLCGDGTFAWNDIPCGDGYGFICEFGCDDGNPCTTDSVGPSGECVFAPNTAACDDGNPCTVNDACQAGACGGAPKNCNDNDLCTVDSCGADGVCVNAALISTQGASSYQFCPGTATQAQATAQCQARGMKLATLETPEENTFVSAETQAYGFGVAWVSLTDAATEGTFVWGTGAQLTYSGWCPNEPNGTNNADCVHINFGCGGIKAWNDAQCGNSYAFVCELNCDDSNGCTSDTAVDKQLVCANNPITGDKVCGQTGNPGCTYAPCQDCVCGIDPFCCTTAWDGLCVDETFDPCGDACTLPATCDDGSACTSGDTCMAGECVGATINCDDGIGCTADSCDTATGCTYGPGSLEAYGDNDYLFCSDALDQPSAQATCAKLGGNLVTINTANENQFVLDHVSGMGLNSAWIGYNDVTTEGSFVWPNGQTTTFTGWCPGEPNDANNEDCVHINWGCGNGSFAWNDFACSAAQTFVCEFGCDDDNGCTTDNAAGSGQCANPAVAATTPVCNVTGPAGCAVAACQDCVCGLDPFCCDTSWDGICVGEAANECAGPCSVPVPTTCDDGNGCTLDDVCQNSACVGTPKNCDDGNICTADSCDSATGECIGSPLSGAHACGATGGPGCSYAPCQDCVCAIDAFCCNTSWDGICVDETYDPCGAACTIPTPCDDGDACTTGDVCAAGVCQAVPTVCDDGNQCTDDSCNPADGQCVFTNSPSGIACQVTGPAGCSLASCQACVCGLDPFCCNTSWDSICVGEAANECNSACVFGAACDDGNPCTVNDTCQAGTCVGAPKDCNDNDLCTEDSCGADGTCVNAKLISTQGASSYQFCPGTATQGQATAQCQARGMKLATLETPEENTFVSAETQAYGFGVTWVSLTDAAIEGTFVWGTGAQLTYSGWCPNEPNNVNDEDCVHINFGCGGIKAWNDAQCSNSYAFVCELDCADTNTCTSDSAVNGQLSCEYGPLPGANCCQSHDQTGCGDPDCQACVCGMDPFCCDTSWDDICAGEAQNQCAAQCGCANPELYCSDGNATTVDTCSVAGSCNGNLVNGSCYMPASAPAGITWNNAQSACAAWGGHLVTINNSTENAAVRTLMNTYCGATVTGWIGLNDIATEGQYVWAGNNGSGYFNWNAGEPNNVGNEDVVQMYANGFWNDLPQANNQLCYVCEKSPGAGFCVNTK